LAPIEIMNRLHETACHNVLAADLAALPPSMRVTTDDADDALLDSPISSTFNGKPDFRSEFLSAGRAALATCTYGPAAADRAALRQQRSRTYRGRARAVGREVQR